MSAFSSFTISHQNVQFLKNVNLDEKTEISMNLYTDNKNQKENELFHLSKNQFMQKTYTSEEQRQNSLNGHLVIFGQQNSRFKKHELRHRNRCA